MEATQNREPIMEFHPFTTNREACSKSGLIDTADEFYAMATSQALAVGSAQFYQQLNSERTWEEARKPYYNVWPSIVPMLTRLNLDLDSGPTANISPTRQVLEHLLLRFSTFAKLPSGDWTFTH